MKMLIGASCTAILLAMAPALAQTPKLNQQDKMFIKSALGANLAQVKAGHLAEQKAQKPAVKVLGLWLSADDHYANQRLEAIAKKAGYTQQPTLTQQGKAVGKELRSANGSEFDHKYLMQLKQAETKAIVLFKAEGKSTQNPKLKSYAMDLVPVLDAHLKGAKMLISQPSMASQNVPQQGSGSSMPPQRNNQSSRGGVPNFARQR